MIEEWLNRLLGRGNNTTDPRHNGSKNGSANGLQKGRGAVAPAPFTRHSNGLEQFFGTIQDQQGLSLLDLSPASQTNIAFLTGLGHRVYSEDILSSLDRHFPDGDQTNPEAVQEFLDTTFNFRDYDFDGALVWDTLQFLSPTLMPLVIDRLFRTLRPHSCLLAYFHSDEKASEVPIYHYRIVGPKTLELAPRGWRKPAQPFNNRALERIFHRFQSVKFFLTRESLREVIVRR